MRCEVFIALCIMLVVFVATLPKMYWIYAISIYRAEKLRRFFNGDCECFLFNATFQQPYSIDQNEFWHTNWDTLFNGIFPGPAYWFVSCRILIYDTLNHPITQMCDFNFFTWRWFTALHVTFRLYLCVLSWSVCVNIQWNRKSLSNEMKRNHKILEQGSQCVDNIASVFPLY